MNVRRLLHHVIIFIMYLIYIYGLFKVVLFKFRAIEPVDLWRRLERGLGDPGAVAERAQSGNLIPFREINRSLHHVSGHSVLNLAGNVMIFAPYGMLLALLANNRITAAGALLRSFGLSLCLEGAQLVLSLGSFDVDDLLLNTSGGIMGFLVAKFCVKLGHKAGTIRRGRREAHD
ncbi:VanZ family protein [Paenibacillus arenilitoris]|uniref:VanZ family protein n=1 Tax=Paenibacillus arenilitoris TaxID=2772299 RepID=A0A927CNR9_9BACL|nr:VanZ family protein [Paenibacillus arenilitoris]MBD2869978.1 VanZ family protein [Paenibacillus arenilitoris]